MARGKLRSFPSRLCREFPLWEKPKHLPPVANVLAEDDTERFGKGLWLGFLHRPPPPKITDSLPFPETCVWILSWGCWGCVQLKETQIEGVRARELASTRGVFKVREPWPGSQSELQEIEEILQEGARQGEWALCWDAEAGAAMRGSRTSRERGEVLVSRRPAESREREGESEQSKHSCDRQQRGRLGCQVEASCRGH